MDSFIYYSINFVYFMNVIIKTLIPLSFTIFIFAYREQKEVAYSLFKKKISKTLIMFISTTVLLILSNVLLIFDSATVKDLSFYNLIYLDFLSLLWLVLAVYSYRRILRNINVIKEFNYNIESIKKSFKNIDKLFQEKKEGVKNDHKFASKLQKEIKNVSIASEICFQILIAKDKYKLSNDFTNSFKLINNVLVKKLIEINSSQDVFSKVVPYSGTLYYYLYVSTLKYLNDLLEISFKGGKDNEINLIIDDFCSIKPNSFYPYIDLKREWKVFKKKTKSSDHMDLESLFKDFYNEYYCMICQVILTLYKNNDNRTARVFGALISQELDKKKFYNQNDFLSLTTSLLIRAIHTNNLKLLTDITNVFLNLMNSATVKTKEMPKINNVPIQMKKLVGNIEDDYELHYKISRVMFLGIIKAIELGHYQCAGFLIKSFVKTFSHKKIKLIIESLYDDIDNIKPNLELSKKLTELLSTKITFSTSSYKYCFLKAVLLVALQQHYVTSVKKIKLLKQDEQLIDLGYFFKGEDYHYLGYIKDKVEGLNSLYGLISIKDKHFKQFFLIKGLNNH
ncbi:hypothetical protein [Bacillus toyonensis]|uniref:hypothetical protein n=3 Tax=Bacillus toyonensis TaxID=155322 RepID=UPI00211E0D6E|nr:hypothetical protein [Bacillus toyonensis]